MYAIIEEGGRQFKVAEGLRLCIDYRDDLADKVVEEPKKGQKNSSDIVRIAKQGAKVEFDKVLALRNDDGLKIGKPALEGAKVLATVLSVQKGPKLVVQKFRRRKNSRRRTGHRQVFIQVSIDKIEG